MNPALTSTVRLMAREADIEMQSIEREARELAMTRRTT